MTCPRCSKNLIERDGVFVCPCGQPIYGCKCPPSTFEGYAAIGLLLVVSFLAFYL